MKRDEFLNLESLRCMKMLLVFQVREMDKYLLCSNLMLDRNGEFQENNLFF
jgi:hypothetical protein